MTADRWGEVVRLSPDRLSREVWRFGCLTSSFRGEPFHVILRSYQKQQRTTTRHKWKAALFSNQDWYLYSNDDPRIYRPKSSPGPTPPNDVIDEAIAAARASVHYHREGAA